MGGLARSMISGQEALARLREGNRRFVASIHDPAATLGQTRRPPLLHGQQPFAIILGCSDSRVPAEIVFDQGFGDLFVIRVAGNIVAPSQVGSVEFAASRYGTKLVVVMGHSNCGAILESLNLRSIVDRVRPAVETVIAGRRDVDRTMLVDEAVRANVRASVD